ncbi:hypothetical protein C0J52_02820 [Blattella germanica]|nr:hypothetical protein C0J52_02820 [Blattella germanica]
MLSTSETTSRMSSRKRRFVVHSEARQLNIGYSVNTIFKGILFISVFSLHNIVLSPPDAPLSANSLQKHGAWSLPVLFPTRG